MLSKLGGTGLDKDGDGDVDFNDLTAAFSGSSTKGGGGLMDTLGGMFGGR
jgi:hypothetical protein